MQIERECTHVPVKLLRHIFDELCISIVRFFGIFCSFCFALQKRARTNKHDNKRACSLSDSGFVFFIFTFCFCSLLVSHFYKNYTKIMKIDSNGWNRWYYIVRSSHIWITVLGWQNKLFISKNVTYLSHIWCSHFVRIWTNIQSWIFCVASLFSIVVHLLFPFNLKAITFWIFEWKKQITHAH